MRSTLALLVSLAIAPLASVPAQQAPSGGARVAAAVNGNVLRGHLEYLADDALEGRAPGTRGGDLAAKYIAAQFRRLGLEPAGDSGSYYQRVPIISLTPTPTLAVTAPAARPLTWKDDYVLWSMRNDSSVSVNGEAVFVGYGIVAPEVGWNDYAGAGREGEDRGRPRQRSRPAGLDHLSGEDSHLLRPLDVQDRRGAAAGRRRAAAGPYDRERDVSVDHGALGLDRPAGAAGDSAGIARGRRVVAGGHRRPALQAGRAGSRGAHRCRSAGRASSRCRWA